MAKAMTIDGQKRVVEKVLGRRKFKSTYEYEVRAAACYKGQDPSACLQLECAGVTPVTLLGMSSKTCFQHEGSGSALVSLTRPLLSCSKPCQG